MTMQPGDIFDVEAIANAVSPYHAAVGKFVDARGFASGDGTSLLRRGQEVIARIRGAVRTGVTEVAIDQAIANRPLADHELFALAAHGPFQDEVSRARLRAIFSPTPPPRNFRVPFAARTAAVVAAGSMISNTRRLHGSVAKVRAGVASLVETGRVAGAIVPGLVIDNLRRDLRGLSIVTEMAVRQARRTAEGFAASVIGYVENEMGKVAGMMAPLAKFVSKGAVIHQSIGPNDPRLLSRAIRNIAIGSAAGAAFFVGMAGAAEPNQAARMRQPVISGQIDQKVVDSYWADVARMTATQPQAPRLSVPGGVAPIKMAQTAQAPNVRPGGSLPPAMPAGGGLTPSMPGSMSPGGGIMPSVSPVAPSKPGATGMNKDDFLYPTYAPTSAFIRFAVATLGVNTENHEAAEHTIGRMVANGMACMKSAGSGGRCSAQAPGITMDFATGRFTATLKPMRNVTTIDRAVAVETPRDGIRVTDQDALNIVLAEHEGWEKSRSMEAVDGDDDPDISTKKPN
ncbi:hypothetical protein [Bosea sp. RAC05]|uniref:hypothetical protein n=1 Tax=Bosea sp. RAC05 TaxID=1842539 RepID=UPI00083D484A|nr:hypothetical protein [Bosea sp. RAC05]AOG02792.1 hypothetical protein BSY19_4951 [Bosea sp. RAC05]